MATKTATPEFKWRAMGDVDPATQRRVFHEGTMHAATEDVVRSTLIDRGLTPVIIEQKSGVAFGNTEWSVAKLTGKPSGKDMAAAYRILASLVRAGVPLPEAVDAVADGSRELMIRETFADMRDRLAEGTPLGDAMRRHPKVFDEMTIELVTAAVEGGFLGDTLERVAIMADNRNRLRRAIRGALVMPVITLVAAIGVGIMMSIVMIPEMAKMLEDMNPGGQLPPTTRLLVWFSEHAAIIGVISLLLAVGLFVLSRKVLRFSEPWAVFKSKTALRVPVMGRLVRLQAKAGLTRGLQMLVKAGVQQSRALQILTPTMVNRMYRVAVGEMADAATSEGRPISDVMRGHPDLFDFALVKMIQSGEKSGSLDDMLGKIADEQEGELDAMTDNLAALINPLALIVVGAVLAILAGALYGPVLAVAQAI